MGGTLTWNISVFSFQENRMAVGRLHVLSIVGARSESKFYLILVSILYDSSFVGGVQKIKIIMET